MFLREKLFLQLIAYSEDKKQKFQIIKCINHNQYFELKKIAINILQGVLPLKKDQLKYLKNSKTLIRKLAEGKVTNNYLAIKLNNIDIKLNNNLISESGTNYMYKALLEALLTYDDNTKRIQLAYEGFSGDSGDFSQTNPEAPPYNHGLKTCFKWFKEHGVVEFVGLLRTSNID